MAKPFTYWTFRAECLDIFLKIFLSKL